MFNHKNHTKNAIEVAKKIRGLGKKIVDKPTKNIKNVDELDAEIKRREIDKYPSSAYDVSTGTVDHDGVELQAMYVKFKKDDGVLTNDELKHMNHESIVLRELSLIAGIWNMYRKDDSHTFMNHADKIEDILQKFIEKAMGDKKHAGLKARLFDKLKLHKPRDNIDEFVNKLASELAKVIGCSKNDVIRQIRNAEQYYVAEYHQQQALVFESKIDGKTILQVDIPTGNQLSDEQKKEYIKIHEAIKPGWFNHLALWEQDWLLKHVPKTLNDDWESFMKIFQSSAMQHLPGIKNARTNYLMEVNPQTNEHTVISSSKKTATLIPYEMPATDQANHINGNAVQLIKLLKEDALSNFENTWGNVIDKRKIKPLIFIGSLLSNTLGASEDSVLTEQQIEAINRYAASQHDIQVIAGNEPINFFRAFFLQDEKRWRYINDVMKYAGDFYQEISKSDADGKLNANQKKQKQLIASAIEQLDVLKSMDTSNRLKFNIVERRNYEAFKTAYASILVEAMGGAVSTNCKSGKDRTGLDEIYRAAMLLYFQRYGKLPGFDDVGQDRLNYIKIFSQIFNTMKAQEAAAMNTPGSFGLKDSALVLCDDIAQYLGKSYQYSNQRAEMNKSQILEKDEMTQKSEMRKLNKRGLDENDDDVESLLSYVKTTRNDIASKAEKIAAEARNKINVKEKELQEVVEARAPDKTNKKVNELQEIVEDVTKNIEAMLGKKETWTNHDEARLSETAINAMMKTTKETTIEGMLAKLRAIAKSVAEHTQKYGKNVRVKTKEKGKDAKDAADMVLQKFIFKPIIKHIFAQQGNSKKSSKRLTAFSSEMNSSSGKNHKKSHSMFAHHSYSTKHGEPVASSRHNIVGVKSKKKK